MSPDDFERGPELNHPEVTDRLSVQPAELVTLRHLVGVVTNKTVDGFELDESYVISLESPAQGTLIDVKRYKDNHPEYNQSWLASIHVTEKVGPNGESMNTNYFIKETPDGLFIEKESNTFDTLNEIMKSYGKNTSQIARLAAGSLLRLAFEKSERRKEEEMGLGFVSEYEARFLLKLIDRLDPKH